MPPKIDSYRFGEVVIDGQSYTRDVIVYPDRVQANWWRRDGHNLALADLEDVLRDPPAVLVIGQGAYGRMAVPEETCKQLRAAGIQLKIYHTDRACQVYNRLRDSRKVVAALHLTC